jgi:hypothetical protein
VQMMKLDSVDLVFDLLAPAILALLSILITYSVERLFLAGRPLTPYLKALNLYGFLLLLGGGYVMSLTGLFGLSPTTLWVTEPTLAALMFSLVWWRHRTRSRDKDSASGAPRS